MIESSLVAESGPDMDVDCWFTGARTNLIRDLQKKMGHEPCFRTDRSEYCMFDCQWRFDCCRPVAELKRGF